MVDTVTKLNIGFDIVEKMVHIADVHVRLVKRHEEYREAFSKVYEYVKKTPEKTIVLIAGDLLHSKIDLSPEAVQLASEFLKNLADARPTILISGNHDCLLTNKTRLDSLSPIVDNLNHKNLFYLKDTGLYGCANILFNNMSVFDDPEQYIKIEKITKKIKTQYDTKIALYHGGVHGVLTDIGYMIENKLVNTSFFEGHDIIALGDIHKAQTFYIDRVHTIEETEKFAKTAESDEWEVVNDDTLTDKVRLRKKKTPIFRYPGSLIQQNHGETLDNHGFSVWDIQSRTFDHVEISNDYGYFTIEIDDGKLITDISKMPSKPKLRVRCKESVASEVKKIIAEIRQTKEITDLVYMRVDGDDLKKQVDAQIVDNLGKITNIDYQNRLIESYLKDKYTEVMDDDTLVSVKTINKKLNELLSKDDQSKGIRWKPIKFEFSNMFSYGEDNVLDFTKLSDAYGLFAANASGKSSLMDALCFTVFDKSARAFKASHVINSQKMTFSGKFTFEINGIQYVIERKGARDKKNNVKVDVNFYKLNGDEKISLNSEARRSTNEIIRDYLGTYEDFVLTSLALQGNQGSFIDMGQTERKELLSQFIGLNIFDSLNKLAADESKELSGAVKAFNKEDNSKKILDMESNIGILDARISDLVSQKDSSNKEKQDLETKIQEQKDKIINLENVPTDIKSLTKEKSNLETKINDDNIFTSHVSITIDGLKQSKSEIESELSKYDPEKLEEDFSKYNQKTKSCQKFESSLDKLKSSVSNKIAKIKHLETHEYDPNCKYCCNNVFVKDAISAKESLVSDKEEATELLETINKLKSEIEGLAPSVEAREKYQDLKTKKQNVSSQITEKELSKTNTLVSLEKNSKRLVEVINSIDLYEKSKEAVETNKAIQSEIDKLTDLLSKVNVTQKSLNTDYMSAYSKKVSFGDQISSLKKRIEETEKSEEELAAYQYYLTAIGKDGIPYQIISEAVPKIEQEVNNILSQIVEFTMAIETDGKNVNVYIKYEDRKWPLELCSGMEKFISALALRVALINISNLPRPNFLVVDEGFGALDADNMAMIHALFDYLKTNFDFIIVISHLDAMRDMVDKQLEVKKENGFSKIDNSK
jgi:DNA repair exonuclease SbcCD ATPase subunit/DNA repair exonuclease SbcCD nuclease subunit